MPIARFAKRARAEEIEESLLLLFMSKKGPQAGAGSDVYFKAYQFLRDQEFIWKSNKGLKNEKENP
jgi:hypothetical protein